MTTAPGTDQARQLEAAIAAQESLRSALGDAVVDATIQALRQQIARLMSESSAGAPGDAQVADEALASLRSHLPEELAAKAQAIGSDAGERKLATVLFADLSGFTAISERADPELIRAFQKDLFSDLARIIYQHEGFVEKFVGDAILAVFGAPIAHEDDPERALRVALAMRERMAVLNRHWAERLGTSVTLHVGINTGPVVGGLIGSELVSDGGAYAVTGDTVNSASRLQNAAQPAQILVSRTTYRQTRGAFTFRALEPIAVKNRREPLDAYELLRARLLPNKIRGIQELAQAFVGRDAALAELDGITDQFIHAKTEPIVIVTGEAGIGKSRLVSEWRKHVGERAMWLEGRCFPHTQMLSYSPLLDMLRRYAGIVDDDTERRARQRLDSAAEQLLPGDSEARAILANLLAMRLRRDEAAFVGKLSARELRERVFGVAERLFSGLAAARPLVVFLEDMQWADLTSLELIQHLATGQTQPFMLVMAARPDTDSALAALEAKLAPHTARITRIALEPLNSTATASMVHALLSIHQLPGKLVSLISDKAEGNPFFVEEIIRALIERGGLEQTERGWTVTPLLEKITVPETLQGLIMARIDRLPDETKDVVQHASVIGRTFLYRVLLAIARSSPTLDADLTHLERSELILQQTRDVDVEYAFRHALTQETAYHSLLTTRRRDMHRRVGAAMERIFAGRIAEYYSIVADHFDKGEDWDKASDYWVRAADQASQQMTLEARQQYEQTLSALEHISRPTPEQKRRRIDATLGLSRDVMIGAGLRDPGDIQMCLERLRQAEKDVQSLLKVRAPRAEDRERYARVIAWNAQGKSMGGQAHEKISDYLDQIKDLNVQLEPDLAARFGQVLVHRGLFREAVDMLTPAVKQLDPMQAEWIHANGALAVAEAGSGRYTAGLARAEAGVTRARNLQRFALLAPANNYLGFVHVMGGDWESVRDVHQQQSADATKMQLAVQGALDTLECAGHALRREHQPEHHERMRHILREDGGSSQSDRTHTRASEQPVLGAWHEAMHARVAIHLGELDTAVQRAEAARALAQQREDSFGLGLALRMLGWAHAASGARVSDVDDLMRQSREVLTQAGCTLEAARTQATWGELMLERGDRNGIDRLRDAQRILEECGIKGAEIDDIKALVARPMP